MCQIQFICPTVCSFFTLLLFLVFSYFFIPASPVFPNFPPSTAYCLTLQIFTTIFRFFSCLLFFVLYCICSLASSFIYVHTFTQAIRNTCSQLHNKRTNKVLTYRTLSETKFKCRRTEGIGHVIIPFSRVEVRYDVTNGRTLADVNDQERRAESDGVICLHAHGQRCVRARGLVAHCAGP